jgi:hypothetical protein
MDNPVDGRPFFMDLWREHRFHVDLVASQAGVSEETVLSMLRYQPVDEEEAQKVLAALGKLYYQEYTLLTVSVRLLAEGDTSAQTAQ